MDKLKEEKMDFKKELEYAMAECERLSKVADFWQKRYYQLNPPHENPKIDFGIPKENLILTEISDSFRPIAHDYKDGKFDYRRIWKWFQDLQNIYSVSLLESPSDSGEEIEAVKLLQCPFCGDDDFDKIGLKHHLNNYCTEYDNT